MGLEQRLRRHYRFARKNLQWKRLSREERVFVKEFKDVIVCRNAYALRVENVCELLQESAIHLSPQVHAYVQNVFYPLHKHLDTSKKPEYQKFARQLRRYVQALPDRTDRALRNSIVKLEQRQSSLEARVAGLQEKVKRIPGFSKLYDEHYSLERRYTKLLASYRSLEEELGKRVLRATYNSVREEKKGLEKRLRQRISRELHDRLQEKYDGLHKSYVQLRNVHRKLSQGYATIAYDLVKQKRYRIGIQVYERALVYAPEQATLVRGTIMHNIGVAHENQCHYKSAFEWYTKAAATVPGHKGFKKSLNDCRREIKKSA